MEDALSGECSREWKAAIDSEYQSFIENGTWDIVPLPKGRIAVGSKWVFKVKYNEDGTVERLKARFVVKGYSQKPGLDYDENLSPVARFSSIRTLLAYAVEQGMLVHQMDVVTAFLNGKLEKEMYIEQPIGYEVPGKEYHVCKLNKTIYGLKQSPRCWNQIFHWCMVAAGFVRSSADPCLYIRDRAFSAIQNMQTAMSANDKNR